VTFATAHFIFMLQLHNLSSTAH